MGWTGQLFRHLNTRRLAVGLIAFANVFCASETTARVRAKPGPLDRNLAFQCQLAADRPDLRSAARDAAVRQFWRERETSWNAKPLDHHIEVLIRQICERSLGPLPSNSTSAGWSGWLLGHNRLLISQEPGSGQPAKSRVGAHLHLWLPKLWTSDGNAKQRTTFASHKIEADRAPEWMSESVQTTSGQMQPPPGSAESPPDSPVVYDPSTELDATTLARPRQLTAAREGQDWAALAVHPDGLPHLPSLSNPPVTTLPPDQLEPWPPPTPSDAESRSLVVGDMKTVGDAADALSARLARAGHRDLRFWSAPGGVAIVVPCEAVDASGARVSSVDSAGHGLRGILVAGLTNMFSTAIRDERVLLVVLTSDQRARHPQTMMTKKIATHWGTDGDMRPRYNREQPLTRDHFVAIFAYELHRDGADEPHLVLPDKRLRTVTEELAAAGVSFDGLLQ